MGTRKGETLQSADTPDCEVKIIFQEGHPGLIFGSQSIFYKGEMVSTYVWKENQELIGDLAGSASAFILGSWSMSKEDVVSEFKVENKTHRDALVQTLQKIGKAANYTGMMDVEFLISMDDSLAGDDPFILEFNPRFSGGVHCSVGSGFLEDYMDLLYAVCEGTPESDFPNRESWPLIRSDAHTPNSRLKDFNPLKFYLNFKRMWQVCSIAGYFTSNVPVLDRI